MFFCDGFSPWSKCKTKTKEKEKPSFSETNSSFTYNKPMSFIYRRHLYSPSAFRFMDEDAKTFLPVTACTFLTKENEAQNNALQKKTRLHSFLLFVSGVDTDSRPLFETHSFLQHWIKLSPSNFPNLFWFGFCRQLRPSAFFFLKKVKSTPQYTVFTSHAHTQELELGNQRFK